MEEWFLERLNNAIKNGIHIINVTQCSGGAVMMGHYETSSRLKKMQVKMAFSVMMVWETMDRRVYKSICELSIPKKPITEM